MRRMGIHNHRPLPLPEPNSPSILPQDPTFRNLLGNLPRHSPLAPQGSPESNSSGAPFSMPTDTVDLGEAETGRWGIFGTKEPVILEKRAYHQDQTVAPQLLQSRSTPPDQPRHWILALWNYFLRPATKKKIEERGGGKKSIEEIPDRFSKTAPKTPEGTPGDTVFPAQALLEKQWSTCGEAVSLWSNHPRHPRDTRAQD